MSNYVAISGSGGSVAPTKVGPGPLSDKAYDRVLAVQTCSFVKSPHSISFGGAPSNPVGLFFGTSESFASIGAEAGDTARVTGSSAYTIIGTPAVGTTLNLHANAYSCSLADKGKILFVYNSSLSTGAR